MLRKLLMMTLIMCASVTLAFAQDGVLTGKITSEETGEELTGVNIYIVELG